MIRFIDMHCDTISELYQDHAKGGEASIRDCALSVNLDKLEMGGCGLQNFALFTHLKTAGDSPFLYCLKLADTFFYRDEGQSGADRHCEKLGGN